MINTIDDDDDIPPPEPNLDLTLDLKATLEQSTEAAVHDFVRYFCLDNDLESTFEQINRFYEKQHEQGWKNDDDDDDDDDDDPGEFSSLEELYVTALEQLQTCRTHVRSCQERLELGIDSGQVFRASNKKKSRRRSSRSSEPPLMDDDDEEEKELASLSCRRKTTTTTNNNNNNNAILQPGQFVAAKVARSHELWILASVLSYMKSPTPSYLVQDEDAGEEEEVENNNGHTSHRQHIVPASAVMELPITDNNHWNHRTGIITSEETQTLTWHMYPNHSRVMAMYPNTTSFYYATVMLPNPRGSSHVLVQFDDDADESSGHVPERKVPYEFVCHVPDIELLSE